MYFCSISFEKIKETKEKEKSIISASTLTKIRKRLGSIKMQKIKRLFVGELVQKNIIDGKYLFTDTISLEKNIAYPIDLSLLKRVIEGSVKILKRAER